MAQASEANAFAACQAALLQTEQGLNNANQRSDLVTATLNCAGAAGIQVLGPAYSLNEDNSLVLSQLQAMWGAFITGAATDATSLATVYNNAGGDTQGNIVC